MSASSQHDELVDQLRAEWLASGNITEPFDETAAIHRRITEWLVLKNLPPLRFAVLLLLLAAFNMLILVMRYTFWQIVATLAIVEAPQISFRNDRAREPDNDSDNEPRLVAEQQTYTSSLRGAIRHLYRVGGPFAFWRGFAVSTAYFFVGFVIYVSVGAFFNKVNISPWGVDRSVAHHIFKDIRRDIESTVTHIALIPLGTAFTHIVMTVPTFRIWLRRVPPLRTTFARVAPAYVVYQLAKCLTFTVPEILRHICGLDHDVDLKDLSESSAPAVVYTISYITRTIDGTPTTALTTISNTLKYATSAPTSTTAAAAAAITAAAAASTTTDMPLPFNKTIQLVADHTAAQKLLEVIIWLLAQAARILLLVPAGFALIRVQAALLPEEDEPIVPLDRSFGTAGPGSGAPGILRAAAAPLGLRAALRSYKRTDRRRLLKLYAKMVAVELVVRGAFGLLLGYHAVKAGSNWNPEL